jgi:LmbE family N-acetylglucosaminyl deacetylase
MPPTSSRALAVFAHPDDAELGAFGLLTSLARGPCEIAIANVTVGEHTRNNHGKSNPAMIRDVEAKRASTLIGARYICAYGSDGRVHFDADTTSWIDDIVAEFQPDTVVTHHPPLHGFGHQDHRSVGLAATNVALRAESVNLLLHAEPPLPSPKFEPNYFVDITDTIHTKLAAIRMHESEGNKPCLRPEFVLRRAEWWAMQVYQGRNVQPRYFEAYSIVRCLC